MGIIFIFIAHICNILRFIFVTVRSQWKEEVALKLFASECSPVPVTKVFSFEAEIAKLSLKYRYWKHFNIARATYFNVAQYRVAKLFHGKLQTNYYEIRLTNFISGNFIEDRI